MEFLPPMVQSVREERRVETSHSSSKLTYADYLLFPDDNLRHEVIGGEHFVTPSPVTRHQRISRDLFYLLMQYLKEHPLGEAFYAPFDVILSDSDIVVPDLFYVSRERSHFVTSKNLQGPPDLVVEILSPGTKGRDRHLKRELYDRAGVREYWLVDPDRDVITVHRRDSGEGFESPAEYSSASHDLLRTPLLPGLAIPVDQLLSSDEPPPI
jgi:Uma2 family endonuclease